MEQKTFVIRAYGVGELAQLYNPHLSHRGAVMQLWRWINHHPQTKTGYPRVSSGDSLFHPQTGDLYRGTFGRTLKEE